LPDRPRLSFPSLPQKAAPLRKNIFLIGRRGHERDENQLTEMLAYLFHEERDLVP
jgi:hypothetical protein